MNCSTLPNEPIRIFRNASIGTAVRFFEENFHSFCDWHHEHFSRGTFSRSQHLKPL